jgi:hypothetical protein
MGFVLLLLLICLIIAVATFFEYSSIRRGISSAIFSFVVSVTVCLFIMSVIWVFSWDSTVDMKIDLANLNSYKHTIEVYSAKAGGDFKAGKEVTDLKYQNYQDQIGRMITDLRDKIVKYNKSLVGKTAYKENWIWSWCVFAPPEGSKQLEMSDYIK